MADTPPSSDDLTAEDLTVSSPEVGKPTLVTTPPPKGAASSAQTDGSPVPKKVATTPPPRRGRVVQSGSTIQFRYGHAQMKVYPLTEAQLSELGTLRGIGVFCITIAGSLFGFGINVLKDLQLASSAPPETLARWQVIQFCCLILALILGAVGGGLLWNSRTKLDKFKDATTFESS